MEPYSDAIVEIRSLSNKLTIGEQKEFDLYCSIPNNILPSKHWIKTEFYDYYISLRNGLPILYILPKQLGIIHCSFLLQLRQPVKTDTGSSRFFEINYNFFVEKSTIVFLNFNMSEYVLSYDSRTLGIKTLIDNNNNFIAGHTYRITDSDTDEEVLIGEIIVPEKLNKGKSEAILKLYNYHERNTGYLYIKDSDESLFITNFTVRSETTIQNIFIQRSDGVWRLENFVFPGETVRIRLEGTSLMGEPILFDGGALAILDTIISDDRKLIYTLSIPKNVYVKKQEILRNRVSTGRFIEVLESHTKRI